MIESEIVAPGSVKGVLYGKHCNRSVRVHKLIYDAMQRMRFKAFEKSLASSASTSLTQLALVFWSILRENHLPKSVGASRSMMQKWLMIRSWKNEAKRILRLPSDPNIST